MATNQKSHVEKCNAGEPSKCHLPISVEKVIDVTPVLFTHSPKSLFEITDWLPDFFQSNFLLQLIRSLWLFVCVLCRPFQRGNRKKYPRRHHNLFGKSTSFVVIKSGTIGISFLHAPNTLGVILPISGHFVREVHFIRKDQFLHFSCRIGSTYHSGSYYEFSVTV